VAVTVHVTAVPHDIGDVRFAAMPVTASGDATTIAALFPHASYVAVEPAFRTQACTV
jgi:hypothetical protein